MLIVFVLAILSEENNQGGFYHMKYSLEKLKSLQKPNGGFERFHSMSYFSSITTEHALRKCMYSKLPKEDYFVRSLLNYVLNLLYQKEPFPDRIEKVVNWTVFTRLMYASWLKIFGVDDFEVQNVTMQWKQTIEYATHTHVFDIKHYQNEYDRVFGKPKSKERYIDPTNFYMVNLLKNELSNQAKKSYFDHIMDKGIYYVFNKNLWQLPIDFDKNETIHYLIAIKMASMYCLDKDDMKFVKEWIIKHCHTDGYWHTSNIKKDGLILSGNWRNKANKLNSIKSFLEDILSNL